MPHRAPPKQRLTAPPPPLCARRQVPVAFAQCAGPEARTGSASDGAVGFSFCNESEASAAVAAARALVAAGLEPKDVCIITPYAGQVRRGGFADAWYMYACIA